MIKKDNAKWYNAEFIKTDYELYFNSSVSPWNEERKYDSQHDDNIPGEGLPVFIKDFNIDHVEKSSLIFTALGCVDIFINGCRIGNDELKPGWTSYNERTLYYDYDVTQYLKSGDNRILAVLSTGWYSGRIAGDYYGSHAPAFMARLCVGEKCIAVTDTSWKVKICGQIIMADIWDGEYRDGRKDSFEKMSESSYDITVWQNAEVCDYFNGEVSPFIGPTVRTRPEMSLEAKSITVYEGINDNGSDYGEINVVSISDKLPITVKKGQKMILDIGQEMVGWAKIIVKAANGTNIKMRYAEMLNDSGEKGRGNDGPKGGVYTINMRSAKTKANYITFGDGEETYRPTFTFFGFRYVEISSDSEFELCSFIGEVVGSAIDEIGSMETSDKSINKLISNIRWGQRSNYLFIPTDCPQRDERLGWTGDTQAFSVTASYNANVLGFFHKWLQDMRDAQSDEGAYSDVVPRVKCCSSENASGWGDAGVIVPYNMYKIYGDKTIIEEHYESMEKYIAQLVENFGMKGPIPRYGDWLAYDFCSNEFISSAFFIHDLDLIKEMSSAIGKDDKAAFYSSLRDKAQKYFNDTYTKNGELTEKTQTSFVLAIAFNLIDKEYEKKAADELVEKIKENGNRLSTGFLGSYNICPALSKCGKDKMAYTLLLQRDEPSWLYSVDQGATTIWERWNSYTLEKGFGDVGMNSFNHYAYGAVQEWMYRYMAGIETDGYGFEKLVLQPRIDMRTNDEIPDKQNKMTWVKAGYKSVKGLIESSWNNENGFTYECTVPDVPTTLYLPILSDKLSINGVKHSFDEFEKHDGCAVIKLAQGKYIFEE